MSSWIRNSFKSAFSPRASDAAAREDGEYDELRDAPSETGAADADGEGTAVTSVSGRLGDFSADMTPRTTGGSHSSATTPSSATPSTRARRTFSSMLPNVESVSRVFNSSAPGEPSDADRQAQIQAHPAGGPRLVPSQPDLSTQSRTRVQRAAQPLSNREACVVYLRLVGS